MIISIKSGASGGSSRGLVHYLAHSKLDPAKEEVERRTLFNENENDLDVRSANQKLSKSGGKPKAEELLHIVIAPSKDEIESVGDDLKTRKAALENIVRETVAALKKEVKAKYLKWIAVTHFNTDNPHAHLALQKEFTGETGRTETLRITREMLHYNETGKNGEKTLHKGGLILAAENKLREIARESQKARETGFVPEAEKSNGKAKTERGNAGQIHITDPNKASAYRERRVLAEEMLAAAEIARRTRNIENLIEHGDKKRFHIKDEETGTTRHISLFDIERKIEINSRRKARQLNPKNAERRAEAISQIVEAERTKFLPIIKQLETIRRHVLGFENRHLNEVQEKHTRLHNQKLLIEKKYERLKTDAPLPLFTPDELQQLQTEAIREQNVEQTMYLEHIRNSNASELNRPNRRERDIQELLGAKMLAALKLEATEKRLANFLKTKDFTKVKIGNSFWSLRLLEQHETQSDSKSGLLNQIKAKTFAVLFPSENKTDTDKKPGFQALKTQISDALENLENVRRNEIHKQKEFVQTLNGIYKAETHPKKNNLAPVFSSFELAEIEDLAQSAGRFDLYEKSIHWQENFLHERFAGVQCDPPNKNREFSVQTEEQNPQSYGAEKIIGKFVMSRAAARSLMANLKIAEAEENIDRYNRDKMFIKYRIKDPKTGMTREVSLRDTQPKKHYYLLDTILQKVLETKEQKKSRDLVRQAAKIKEKELAVNLETCQTQFSRIEKQKTQIQTKYGIKEELSPVFTPKEIAALDARKYQTTDKQEAKQLAKIITEAEKNNRVGRVQDLLNNAAKELETQIPHLSNKLEQANSPLNPKNPSLEPTIKTQETASQIALAEKIFPPARNPVKTETIEPEKTILKEKGRSR